MATSIAQQMNEHLAGFDRHYGLELLDFREDEALARVRVREELCQPYGLVHGGVYAAIAESVASLATGLALLEQNMVALGMSNATSFLRPVTEGFVHAVARRLHAGRSSWIWDVECRDDAGRLCAVTRMTIAVRKQDPARAGEAPLRSPFPPTP